MSYVPEANDKYEAITIVVRQVADPVDDDDNWFMRISDFISADCQVVEDENGDDITCTCGLESMGGFGGTLDQCYEHLHTVGQKLQPLDLARAIVELEYAWYNGTEPNGEVVDKVIKWAKDEIHFEENWNVSFDSDEDEDEGDDFRELTAEEWEQDERPN